MGNGMFTHILTAMENCVYLYMCVCLLIKVLEALLPVGSASNIPTLIQQFDAVEVQHEGIRCQEPPLGFPSALELLTGLNTAGQRPAHRYNITTKCTKVHPYY